MINIEKIAYGEVQMRAIELMPRLLGRWSPEPKMKEDWECLTTKLRMEHF